MTHDKRITAPPPDQLDDGQRRLLQRTVAALGAVIGPRTVLVHDLALAEAWAALGDALKASLLPPRVRELTILLVARHWRSAFEWHAHAVPAAAAGLSPQVVEAIRSGRAPVFGNSADDLRDAAVHDYCVALLRDRNVADHTYARAWQAMGTVGLVDLTALLGHYTNVAMTLVAHRVPLPDGVADPFAGID